MRNATYWLSVACCLFLGGMFYMREQYAMTALIGIAVVAYLSRMALGNRDARIRAREEFQANLPRTSREKSQLLDDLRVTRDRVRGKLQRLLLLGLLIAGGAGLLSKDNLPLAAAFALFLLPVVFFVWRNYRIVSEINRGLLSRGYAV
jgi:hypothetical protein